jgi:ABC-2 type transport system ATP-binding protein
MGAQSPRIVVEALRKNFGDITALSEVNFRMDTAEILGLAGPNGSGKTTLIRALLGIVAPSGGTVRVNGVDPVDFSAAERRELGYMPQHPAVYDDLTVRENVRFFATLYNVSDRDAAVDEALGLVGLRNRADARISELSGGMIRRTSLACALVHQPTLLFLDEPTVGLDPELRAKMWDGFRTRRDNGASVLVSTHYLGEAQHCDRVLFLRDGRVLTVDTPEGFQRSTGESSMEDAFLSILAGRESRETDQSSSTAEGGE